MDPDVSILGALGIWQTVLSIKFLNICTNSGSWVKLSSNLFTAPALSTTALQFPVFSVGVMVPHQTWLMLQVLGDVFILYWWGEAWDIYSLSLQQAQTARMCSLSAYFWIHWNITFISLPKSETFLKFIKIKTPISMESLFIGQSASNDFKGAHYFSICKQVLQTEAIK